ncbi:c-type cytochrome biogenesis protein CcsB [Nesterenkonia flava]|uniref:C-type cytochrome biogenesis protein CcsB n=1 Tax=Nesterenkonia flava TaxID=469799 RepID=A0ABU1FRA4_9MICC|nr:c-type cytochrome biogenesis protein CcsB [Nesterenkonia flava]MDR5711154.1 c-type cytochrome biogenesis protein CcsB [Nesterenkonia flava]
MLGLDTTVPVLTLAPINVELAEYSELFLLIAAFIYTLAFILFAVDTARSSATIRRVEAELAEEHAALQTQARPRELAGAGGPDVSESTDAAVSGGAESSLPADDEHLVDEDMAYVGTKRPLANVAVALSVVAVAAHAFAVIARGVAASRWPLGNMFEFLVGAALIVSLVYLVSLIRRDLRFLGVFVLGLVVTMMVAATIGFPTPIGHVQPALQSPWLAIHVSLAVLSIALFVLTFAMSVLQLTQSKREKALARGENLSSGERMLTRAPFLRLVPKAMSLENWSYRINAVAFVFWTLGPMITGAIWARETWGRYWGWDAKEVWTFVIWVVYAGYLHARATRGWTGNRAAWLSIAGFICIIINYAVVNVFFPGLHSYAGLPE